MTANLRFARIVPLRFVVLCAALVAGGLAGPPSATAQEEPGQWTPIGPDQAIVFALRRHPADPNRVYVGTFDGGIYKSSDGGTNWSHLLSPFSSSNVFAIGFDPSAPQRVYVGTFQLGVFRSDDDGQTWIPANQGIFDLTIRAVAVDPGATQTVLAGTFSGVFRSTDRGSTWQISNGIAPLLPATAIVFDPAVPGLVYLGTSGLGVFRSLDSGQTWQPFNAGMGNRNIVGLELDPYIPRQLYAAAADKVMRLRPGAGVWDDITGNLPTEAVACQVTRLPNRGQLFAVSDKGVYIRDMSDLPPGPGPDEAGPVDPDATAVRPVSQVKSGSFQPSAGRGRQAVAMGEQPPPDPNNEPQMGWVRWSTAPARFILGDPRNRLVWVAELYGTLVVTSNGGGSFFASDRGIQNRFMGSIAAVGIGGTTVLYGGSNTGIALTSESWGGPGEFPWLSIYSFEGAAPAFELTPHPADPSVIFAGLERGGVIKSIDYGYTWSPSGTGIVPANITAIAQSPRSDGTLYVGTGYGIYVSGDSGRTWDEHPSRSLPILVASLLADPLREGRAYFGTFDGQIYLTSDAGKSFQHLWSSPSGQPIVAIASAPYYLHYAVDGAGYLYTSDDLGFSFFRRAQTIPERIMTVAADHQHPWVAYVGTLFGGVYKSDSNAINWDPRNNGIGNDSIFSLAIHPYDSNIVYAGSVGKIYKTTDGAQSWTPLSAGLPTGGYITNVTIDWRNPEIIYATMAETGICKSTNAGATWAPVVTGAQFNASGPLIVSATGQPEVFAGSKLKGLFKSTDAGGTWESSSDGMSLVVITIAIDPATPNRMYAGTVGGGVFRSEDGGEHWQNSGLTNSVILHLAIDPQQTSIVYAAGSAGMYRSGDGGLTWAEAGQRVPYVLSMLTDAQNPQTLYLGGISGILYKSDNAGQTWNLANSGLPYYTVIALALDPVSGAIYASLDQRGIYKSLDAGKSWTLTDDSLLGAAQILSLAVDPLNGDVYAASNGYGVFKTENAGASWSYLAANFTSNILSSVKTRQASPTVTAIYVSVLNDDDQGVGLYMSMDRGQTWNPAASGIANASVVAVATSPHSGTVLYASGVDYIGTTRGVYKSTSMGLTWQPASSGLQGLIVSALLVDPADPNTVYAGTQQDGVYISTNAGANWAPIQSPYPGSYIRALSPAPGGAYAGTLGNGVLIRGSGAPSFTGGVDPTLSGLIPYHTAIDPTNPATIYEATSGTGVVKSTDRGVKWKSASVGLTDQTVFLVMVDPVSPQTVYAGTFQGGVFVSDDGAATWKPFSRALFNKFITAMAIDPYNHKVLYIGTEGGGAFRRVRP